MSARHQRQEVVESPVEDGALDEGLDETDEDEVSAGDAHNSDDVFEDVQPAGEPQSAEQLLTDLVLAIDKYVIAPPAAKVAAALFVLHTWAIDAADYTPRLIIRSPFKRCGKSRLIELLEATCRRALLASSATAAALFHVIEEAQPTLLLDEADTFVHGDEGLRGVLNAGFKRAGAKVLRCGQKGGPTQSFRSFAPVAIAAIGRIPDTVEDRGIVIMLQRKPKTEDVAQFRRDDLEALKGIRPRLARWALDSVPTLRSARPAVPKALHDRQADIWEPLLAVADGAGPACGELARCAAVVLGETVSRDDDDTDPTLLLLARIRTLVAGRQRISLQAIVDDLLRDEVGDWRKAFGGKSINTSNLAAILRQLGVGSADQWRTTSGRERGYYAEALRPTFDRYLQPETDTPSIEGSTSGVSPQTEPPGKPVTRVTAVTTNGVKPDTVTGATAVTGPQSLLS